MRRRLRALHRDDRFVRLERGYPSDPRIHGFVRGLGRGLVAIEQYHDFSCEGHCVFALDPIESIRADARERHFERILRAERLRPRRISVPAHALDNWPALLSWLRRRGRNVIVECQDRHEPIEDFFIGRIHRVDESEVLFANFDTMGRWEPALHRISVSEITTVQFGTPYIEFMSRHLRG
jgi:hypothetical protein